MEKKEAAAEKPETTARERGDKTELFSVSYLPFLQVKDQVEHRIWSFGKKNLFDYIQVVMQWVGGDM